MDLSRWLTAIPVYNEAKYVRDVLAEVRKYSQQILVVDDGSTDDTPEVDAVRPLVDVPFEAHLMVADPDAVVPLFADAGCETLIVHAESSVHLHRTLHHVHEVGASPAVALNPSTPPDAARYVHGASLLVDGGWAAQ